MTRMPAPPIRLSHASRASRPGWATSPASDAAPDPRLDEALKLLLAIGAVLVLLLPAARGSVASIGWLPMWLLGMPLAALWASRGFRLAWPRQAGPSGVRSRRRGSAPQARRRARRVGATATSRAA